MRDPSHYNGNVFAGLASLQLGQHDDARRHYKTAIETQPDNPLAWKVRWFESMLKIAYHNFILIL